MNPRAIVHSKRVRRSALEVVGDTLVSCVKVIARIPEAVAVALSSDTGELDRAVTWTLAAIVAFLTVAAIAAQLWLRFGPKP